MPASADAPVAAETPDPKAHPWDWFNALLAEFPEAQKYQPNFQRLRDTATEYIDALEQAKATAEERAQRSDGLMLDRYRQFMVELTTTAFDKQSTYTTAVLSVGYVGLFTTWNLTAASIPAAASRFVVVSALASLVVFILFEVFKMIHGQVFALRTLAVVKAEGDRFDVEHQKYQSAIQRSQPWFYTVWIVSVIASLVLGLASASVLIYAHLEKLFFPTLS